MTRERVAQYQEILNTEGTTLARLEEERIEAQNQIAEAEEAIKTLQEELKELKIPGDAGISNLRIVYTKFEEPPSEEVD